MRPADLARLFVARGDLTETSLSLITLSVIGVVLMAIGMGA